MYRVRFLGILLTWMMMACGGSTSSTTEDTGRDAQVVDAAAANDATESCNSLDLIPHEVVVRYATGAPAPAQGGPLTDGTYVLTDATIYVGNETASGPERTLQSTLRVAGRSAEIVRGDDGNSVADRQNATFELTGTTLISTNVCPLGSSNSVEYTATATAFTVYFPASSRDGGAKTMAETFTKQ